MAKISAIRFGVALLAIGLVATILAGVSHWLTLQRLNRNETPDLSRWPLSVTVAIFLAIVGFLSLRYVFQGWVPSFVVPNDAFWDLFYV